MARSEPQSRPVNNLLGAAWMLASALGFTVFLLLSKLLSEAHNPGFLAFWRTAIALLVIGPYVLFRDPDAIRVYQPLRLGLRSLLGTLGFVLGMFAVSDAIGLPLSQFNAISFSRALFVTVLAALILREHVGAHRWGAVAAGFVGVLIMVRPELFFFWQDAPASDPNSNVALGTTMAIASAFFLAMAIILVKTLTELHSPMTLLLWASILSTILLLPFLFLTWSEPTLKEWGLITLMALCGTGAQFCYITAMSVGDASFLSPMDYLRLPLAAAADWLVFRLFPGPFVWIGASIIIGSTLYITVRERVIRQRK